MKIVQFVCKLSRGGPPKHSSHPWGGEGASGAGAACTTPAQLAVHGAIWESALRAINGLLTGLRVDDTDFTADDPPTRASVLLRRLITVDYHATTTRSGHPLRPKSVRVFAHK